MSSNDRTRVVAAFDFDGTVSRRDTLVPFLAKVAGMPASAVAASAAAWSAVRGHLDWRNRDDVKAHMIQRLLEGRSERDLQRRGGEYATALLDKGLRPEVVVQLQRHVAAGHDTLLVSASLVYYLDPLARWFHLAGVIAVDPEVRDGVLTGAMRHPNVRAEQKAVRLRQWLGAPAEGPLEGVELWAYGNTSGDHALLELADHAFWLGKPDTRPAGVVQFRPDVAF
jgi:phosphatidylglycerophosphatase C